MGKTVTTYLIDGDPKGTQYVFISNKICQMYVIPRSDLSILNERQELQTPAFYILLGEDEATKPKAYIGETENFRERVKDHDSKKSFWQKANLLKDYTISNGDKMELESDKTFPSPSTAADFCIGSSNNGWLVWKDKDGQTLDAVYRKQLE